MTTSMPTILRSSDVNFALVYSRFKIEKMDNFRVNLFITNMLIDYGTLSSVTSEKSGVSPIHEISDEGHYTPCCDANLIEAVKSKYSTRVIYEYMPRALYQQTH